MARTEIIVRPDSTTDRIDYVWGKDISGSLDGAAGIGGLLYVKVNGAIYVPFYDAYGNVMGYFAAAAIFARRESFIWANSGASNGLSFQSMNVCWRSMKNRRVSGLSAKV